MNITPHVAEHKSKYTNLVSRGNLFICYQTALWTLYEKIRTEFQR